MPDLRAECLPLRPLLLAVCASFHDPDPEFGVLRRLFVHWVDRSIGEYDTARRVLLRQLAEMQRSPEEMSKSGRVFYMFDFSDSLEQCLILIRRLLRALEKLKTLR